MPANLIHLNSEVHARAKAHAKENNLFLRHWVNKLILEATGGQVPELKMKKSIPETWESRKYPVTRQTLIKMLKEKDTMIEELKALKVEAVIEVVIEPAAVCKNAETRTCKNYFVEKICKKCEFVDACKLFKSGKLSGKNSLGVRE